MLSVPIKITTQEVKDFPLPTLQINDFWKDIVDPDKDHIYHRKRTRRKKNQ